MHTPATIIYPVSYYTISPFSPLKTTVNHDWVIPTTRRFKGSSGTQCDPIVGIYNPYAVDTSSESGYLDDCTALSHLRCAMGDLGGKLGMLEMVPVTDRNRKLHSFYDENLHLLGPFTGELRSIVTYYRSTMHVLYR